MTIFFSSLKRRLPPQTGTAVRLNAGEMLVIVDPDGEQVADLACFAADDLRDGLSSGRTIDYNGTLRLTTGHVLWSRQSRRLFTIVEDTCAVHDILLAPCSPEMFGILHHHQGHHRSCLENLSTSLTPLGVEERDIASTFNVFMNVAVGHEGEVIVHPPTSAAGARLVLRAETALVAGVTACSAEQSNNGSFKPIDIEVIALR
ncbi:MAG: urea carboxylase-associated family protein [Candidatus Dormibacteraeota bacterium]|nr:urea carboxylase-associated family protein [Candidatus Dormibacteraeota bacterium]